MPELFGLDLAGIIDGAIQDAGGVLTGTFIKVERGARTSGDVSAGRAQTETSHPCRGFIDSRKLTKREQSLVEKSGRIVTIMGASLPAGVVPSTKDAVVMEGIRFEILETDRDPAAATYECLVEG